MAAVFKAVNAKIRSNPYVSYICSTHFWGPASNFGIPIAAVMDTQKSPDIISFPMTSALILYSGVFMRFSLAVTPKNYLLFGCHFTNFGAQSTQMYRYLTRQDAGKKAEEIGDKAKEMGSKAKESTKEAVQDAKQKVEKLTK